MAPIAPGAVEFQIHQVVPAFQINMLNNEKRKNLITFFSSSANANSGTQAVKMSGVKPASGQAATSNNPVTTLDNKEEYFFKKRVNNCLARQVREKRDRNRIGVGSH